MARVAVSDEEATVLKKEFGVALAKSLKESSMLRALLKAKALEMFDEDYDVLYQLVKYERLESGTTVRDLLIKQLKNRGRMQVIETKLPTLTIFVPDLPMGSFSAQSWNTNQQIPLIGIKLTKTNDVPILDAEGREQLLPAKYAPGFPVVVVKEALRVIDSSNPNFHKRTNARTIPTTDGLSFRFVDEAFDRSLNKKKNGRLVFASQLDGSAF